MKFIQICFWALGGWFTWFAAGAAAVSITGALVAHNAGKKSAPKLVGYNPINPTNSAKTAIQGDIANEGSLETLLGGANEFQQSQALKMTEQAMPGYASLAKNLTDQATRLSANPYELPADVRQNLQRKAAEMGVSTGRQGQAAQFSVLRDLGVNELQYGQQNLQEAGSLTGLLSSIAPRVNPMSPMSFYVTPEQQMNTEAANNNVMIGQNNSIAAAKNANATATAGMWGNIAGSLSSFIGGGMGGMFNSAPAAAGASGNAGMAGQGMGFGGVGGGVNGPA